MRPPIYVKRFYALLFLLSNLTVAPRAISMDNMMVPSPSAPKEPKNASNSLELELLHPMSNGDVFLWYDQVYAAIHSLIFIEPSEIGRTVEDLLKVFEAAWNYGIFKNKPTRFPVMAKLMADLQIDEAEAAIRAQFPQASSVLSKAELTSFLFLLSLYTRLSYYGSSGSLRSLMNETHLQFFRLYNKLAASSVATHDHQRLLSQLLLHPTHSSRTLNGDQVAGLRRWIHQLTHPRLAETVAIESRLRTEAEHSILWEQAIAKSMIASGLIVATAGAVITSAGLVDLPALLPHSKPAMRTLIAVVCAATTWGIGAGALYGLWLRPEQNDRTPPCLEVEPLQIANDHCQQVLTPIQN